MKQGQSLTTSIFIGAFYDSKEGEYAWLCLELKDLRKLILMEENIWFLLILYVFHGSESNWGKVSFIAHRFFLGGVEI